MKFKSKPLMVAIVLGLFVIVQRLAPSSSDPASGSMSPSSQRDAVERSGKTITAKVERVVDGDSLYLRGEKKQIRLWAVDAPETNEQGYNAARKELTRLALGKQLRCTVRDIDKYGRTVARCENSAGRDINKAMLDSGTADEYCRFSKNFYGYCD